MKYRLSLLILAIIGFANSCESDQTRYYRITENGKTGFIDNKGTVKIAPSYDHITDFYSGLAAVAVQVDTIVEKDSRFHLFDKTSLRVAYRYLNKKGKFVDLPERTLLSQGDSFSFPNVEDILFKVRFQNNRAVFQDENGKYGYINKKGDVAISPEYEEARPFAEQYAAVSQDGKTWGYIKEDGSFFVKPQFDVLSDFRNGRGAAMIQQGKTEINERGEITIPMYNEFLIDEAGRFIGEPRSGFKCYYTFTADGIAVAESILVGLLGYSFIDKSGEFLPIEEAFLEEDREYANSVKELKSEYSFKDVTRFTNGYAAVTFDGESWIYIDRYFVPVRKGNMVLTYEGAGPFSSDLAAIKKDEKWGYINTSFEEVIPCQYDSCTAFVGELAKVFMKRNNILIESYIDKDNNIVWQQLIKSDNRNQY